MISSGDRARVMRSTAIRIDLSSGTGRRTRLAMMTGEVVCSWATSSGNSRWVAPGFSSCASRTASRTRAGMLSAEASWWVNLVIGRIMSTTSRIWNRPCLDDLIGF